MDIKLYNSLSDQLEVFQPLEPRKVSIYICGPTVYGYVHIGNMRPVVTFDTLRRLFIYLGYQVSFTSNITDVDDKIIQAAIAEGVSEKEITEKYTDYYFWAYREVNALPPTHIPTVTENMTGIIHFIQDLIKKGFAYEVEGDVYFRIGKIATYGQLSNLKIEELKVGARIEENDNKENALDFALWKKTNVGIQFQSPWGPGRPGWHTECVVMINELYPSGRIDIHGGGFDLKFPHHENEIAQSLACHHHAIATYWMHNGFVNIDNEKMSKSLGNVRYANDIIKQYGGNTVRLTMLASHYRLPINFSNDILEANQKEEKKIALAIRQADIQLALHQMEESQQIDSILMARFLHYLCDDLNTANGLMVLHEAIKELNIQVRRQNLDMVTVLSKTIKDMLFVLGIYFENVVLTSEDRQLYQTWQQKKAQKQFAEADELRQQLIQKGLM